jgi:hypothetical protein
MNAYNVELASVKKHSTKEAIEKAANRVIKEKILAMKAESDESIRKLQVALEVQQKLNTPERRKEDVKHELEQFRLQKEI